MLKSVPVQTTKPPHTLGDSVFTPAFYAPYEAAAQAALAARSGGKHAVVHAVVAALGKVVVEELCRRLSARCSPLFGQLQGAKAAAFRRIVAGAVA